MPHRQDAPAPDDTSPGAQPAASTAAAPLRTDSALPDATGATGATAPPYTDTAAAPRSPRARETVDPTLTRLHRLDGDDPATRARRAAVVALVPLPEQEPFSSRAELTLPAADADPDRTPFVVEHEEVAVGFGVLDRGALLDELVDQPERAVLLRAFYVDARAQGRGHGRTAVRLLRTLARSVAPDADIVVLTVNEQNPAAIRAYAAGGFVDVGRYLGGSLGPQRIMVGATSPKAPAAAPRSADDPRC